MDVRGWQDKTPAFEHQEDDIIEVDSNRADTEKFQLGEEIIREITNLAYLGSVNDTPCNCI